MMEQYYFQTMHCEIEYDYFYTHLVIHLFKKIMIHTILSAPYHINIFL